MPPAVAPLRCLLRQRRHRPRVAAGGGQAHRLVGRAVGRRGCARGQQHVADVVDGGELADRAHQVALRAFPSRRPPETFTFSCCRRCTTLSSDSPNCASLRWSMSTWISSSRPPPTFTVATPSTGSSLRFEVVVGEPAQLHQLADLLAAAAAAFGDSASRMIGLVDGIEAQQHRRLGVQRGTAAPPSCRARPGWPGPRRCPRRTRTTSDWPAEIDLSLRRPFTTPSASSAGCEIRVSIPDGAAPV